MRLSRRFSLKKSKVKMASQSQTHEFDMAMTCEGCAGAAKRVLGKCGDKVSNVETDVEKKKVFVTSTMNPEELTEVLKKTQKEITYVGVKQD